MTFDQYRRGQIWHNNCFNLYGKILLILIAKNRLKKGVCKMEPSSPKNIFFYITCYRTTFNVIRFNTTISRRNHFSLQVYEHFLHYFGEYYNLLKVGSTFFKHPVLWYSCFCFWWQRWETLYGKVWIPVRLRLSLKATGIKILSLFKLCTY